MGWSEAIAELDRLREAGREMGGPEAIERLHARGKLTPRERIERLVDAGTFHEIGGLVEGFVAVRGREPRLAPCDALVAGWANVDDRRVFIVADDGSIASGSRGPGGAVKAAFISGLARKQGYPLVQLLEASAPRMQGMMGAQFAGAPGAGDRDGAFGRGWNRGGEIPRVQAAMGSSVGGPSFSAPSCEFILMTKRTGAWGVSGPPVVLGGLQQEVDMQEIGGSAVHADSTGFADYPAEDDDDGLRVIREWLSYFPSNSRQLPPRVDRGDPPDRRSPQLTEIVPVDHRRPYDMHRVIEAIVDDGRFLEMKHSFGKTVITCYARLNGHSVGIVAKQPRFLGGIMDSKGGREDRALRAGVRRLQHPVDLPSGPAGFHRGAEIGARKRAEDGFHALRHDGPPARADPDGVDSQGLRVFGPAAGRKALRRLRRRLADRIGQPGRPRGGREHHHAERGAVRHDEPGAPRGAVPLLPARLASQQRGPRLPHRRHGR